MSRAHRAGASASRRSRSAGIAMLEVAILLPVLLLILFAIIEFGLAFARFQVVTNASREGARAAGLFAAPCRDQDMLTRASTAIKRFEQSALVGAGELSFNLMGTCSTSTVTVTVSYAQRFPVVSSIIDSAPVTTLSHTTTEFNANSLRGSNTGS